MSMDEQVAQIRTRDGRRVNHQSNLCGDCSIDAAQVADYWTNDANFPEPSADFHFWTTTERFLQIQRECTNARARCVENCGRVED